MGIGTCHVQICPLSDDQKLRSTNEVYKLGWESVWIKPCIESHRFWLLSTVNLIFFGQFIGFNYQQTKKQSKWWFWFKHKYYCWLLSERARERQRQGAREKERERSRSRGSSSVPNSVLQGYINKFLLHWQCVVCARESLTNKSIIFRTFSRTTFAISIAAITNRASRNWQHFDLIFCHIIFRSFVLCAMHLCVCVCVCVFVWRT